MYVLLQMMQSFCEKLLQQKQAASIDQSPLQEMSIQDIEDLKQHYLDEMLILSNDNEKIDIHFRRECESMIDELKGKFNGMSIEINKKKELHHLEQVANLSTYPSPRFKSFCYDDDDDYDYEECTIPLNEIDSQIPPSIAITLVLPTLEPEDSLIMRNKELSTIPKKESNEFIKSSVKDRVPIPSESKDTSESDSDCDLPLCDYFYPINSALLVTPLSDFNEDECFNPRGDVDEIELLLHHNTPPPKMSVASILEGFIDEPPLEENDDLFDLESKEREWKKILYDAPIDDLMTEDKVFDPGIPEIFFSPTYVRLPFEDRHYLSLTYVIRIFLPYFTYPAKSHFLLSSESEDTIFDLGISAFHFSSLELVVSHWSGTFMCFNVYLNILNECPMEVCSSTCFVPYITMIWGELS
ncbi:hypothetical protein Tco_0767945 [Tanacetum coccineum]